MFRKLILFTALAAGASSLAAEASARSSAATVDVPMRAAVDGTLLLAQAGDVEVFFDGNGNRVIVDAYSGRVIAIQPPRRAERRLLRREQRSRDLGDQRYYLDDPEDMARYRRDRRNFLGRRVAPPIDEFDGYVEAYPEPEDVYPEEFPRAPGEVYLEEPPPRVVRRDPIERKPLEVKPQQPETETVIIEQGALPPAGLGGREEVAALQILLDRKGASPGVIDGKFGSNVDKAIVAYRSITGENLKSTDAEGIKQAIAASGGDAFTNYTITAEDAAGPYVASVPTDYGAKAKLDKLSYTSVTEALAERFHMDEAYLKALNPEASFNRPGTIIKVANIGQPVGNQVKRIIADKGRKQVRAYDVSGRLVAAYPATIGSSDTPSPTGTHTVSRIAFDPEYTYNPDLNFKQGDNHKVLTIPPGPNGPVGSIWIALSKPTYGIHGTPDPSKIGKTESHGCVRLTNWDAAELAKIVTEGVTVEFVE